jgi:hypothetical protein
MIYIYAIEDVHWTCGGVLFEARKYIYKIIMYIFSITIHFYQDFNLIYAICCGKHIVEGLMIHLGGQLVFAFHKCQFVHE